MHPTKWLLLALPLAACRGPEPRLAVEPGHLPADGFSRAGIVHARGVQPRIASGHRSARLEGSTVIAGVLPGDVVVEAGGRRATLRVVPVWTDRYGDGTPDFLRLDSAADRDAFLRRFTRIAASQARDTAPEVTDCSSLIRHAYREALREGGEPGPEKYMWPWTPAGPRLFRVAAGSFSAADLDNGALSEFADAETLMRRNTHFISRDVARGRPGDILFYRQRTGDSPWHAMVLLEGAVVYHTGPDGKLKGEVRLPALPDLMRHPEPRWRPLEGNPYFLGAYRWNILREDS